MVDGDVAVLVQAVEGGGVGVCPGGFGGEEGEVGAGAGEVVEGYVGDVGVGAGFGARGAFVVVFDGVAGHCFFFFFFVFFFFRCCAVDIGWFLSWAVRPSRCDYWGSFPFSFLQTLAAS